MPNFVNTKTKSQAAPAAAVSPAAPSTVVPNDSPVQVDPHKGFSDAITSPIAPAVMRGLSVGPDFAINYEQNQATQVEGSDPLLRRLSPFMLRVEPPIIYGEGGEFTDQPANGQISVDTFNVAQRGARGYENARSVLARSGLGTMPSTAQTAQEFVVASNNGKATRGKQTGGVTRDLRSGKLGEPAIADFMVAADIARQLSASIQTPPLVLLINPDSLKVSYTKVQQFQDRTRYGYLFHTWGEEQPKISISATCGAFYSGGRGVSYASKRDSMAWQNLMNAFHIYRNNGYIYDTLGKSNAHHMVGVLSIRFDQWVYYGHMESFTWTYDEEHQNGAIQFSMEFTASAMVDTAQSPTVVQPMRSPTRNPGDPRYSGFVNHSFNQPGVFSVGPSGIVGQGQPSGFQPATTSTPPGQRAVITADPTVTSPFGVG